MPRSARLFAASAAMAVLSIVLMPLLGAGNAQAQSDACTTQVIDESAAQVLDIAAVQRSILPLTNLGADVYVRAYQAAPGGSLEAFTDQQLINCANWHSSPAGERKSNLLVVMMAVEPNSPSGLTPALIDYGPGWQRLDGDINSILGEMGRRLDAGDYSLAVTSALEDIAASVSVADQPQYVPPLPGAVPRPFSPPPAPPAMPTDWTPVLIVVGVIAASALLVAIGWLGLMFWRVRSRQQQEHESALADARAAREKFQEAYTAFVLDQSAEADRTLIGIRAEGLKLVLDEGELHELTRQIALAEDGLQAVYTDHASQAGGDDVGVGNEQSLTPQELNDLTMRYTAGYEAVATAVAQQAALEQLVAANEEAIQQVPTKLQQLKRDLGTLSHRRDELAGRGHRALPDDQLNMLRDLVAGIEEHVTANKAGWAVDEVKEATSLRGELDTQLAALARVRDDLFTRYGQLADMLTDLDELRGKARLRLEGLEDRFGQGQCTDCRQQYQSMEELCASADRDLEAAHASASWEVQDWASASTHLDEAARTLVRLREQLANFDSQAQQLDRLPERTQSELNGVDDAIMTAGSGLRLLRCDTDGYREQLEALSRDLSELKIDLARAKPDYAAIQAAAVRIAGAVSVLEVEARREHDRIVEAVAAERRRQEAARRAEIDRRHALERQSRQAEAARHRAPRIPPSVRRGASAKSAGSSGSKMTGSGGRASRSATSPPKRGGRASRG